MTNTGANFVRSCERRLRHGLWECSGLTELWYCRGATFLCFTSSRKGLRPKVPKRCQATALQNDAPPSSGMGSMFFCSVDVRGFSPTRFNFLLLRKWCVPIPLCHGSLAWLCTQKASCTFNRVATQIILCTNHFVDALTDMLDFPLSRQLIPDCLRKLAWRHDSYDW